MPLDRTSDDVLKVGTSNSLLIYLHDDQIPPVAVTDATITVTVYDPEGEAVENAVGLSAPYNSTRGRYRCLIPGDADLTTGAQYTVVATAAAIDWREVYHLTAVE